jgi:hypothetical protein
MEGQTPAANTLHRTQQFRWVTSATLKWQWNPTRRGLCCLCSQCNQLYHVAASCQAAPASGHCAGQHCSWECEARFEPNCVPTCALCKIGERTGKLRCCPFFQDLMENGSRLSRYKSSQVRQRTPGHNEPDTVRTAHGARPSETYSPETATFSFDRLPTASPSNQCIKRIASAIKIWQPDNYTKTPDQQAASKHSF